MKLCFAVVVSIVVAATVVLGFLQAMALEIPFCDSCSSHPPSTQCYCNYCDCLTTCGEAPVTCHPGCSPC